MKYKKIISGLLLAGVLVGGVYNCYNLTQNNTSVNIIKPDVVYAEKSRDIKNEDLKNVAMGAIKKYYGETPDFNKLEFISLNESLEQQIEDINSTIEYVKAIKNKTKEDEKWMKDLEADKNKIKFGTIDIAWTSEKDNEIYDVTFDDKTKEILSIMCQTKVDLSKLKPENFITIEKANKTAEDYIVKNNLDNIKNMKFVGKSEYKNYYDANYDVDDTVMFFYQDANDSSKKANVVIDRTLGKVTYFSVGNGAEREYTKNNL